MIQSDFPTRQPAPKIGENGTWLEWDELTQAYVDTGRPSRGDSAGLSDDIKTALLTIAEKAGYSDEHGQDYYDALYAALYPPAELLSITAVFTQGQNVIYDTDSLDTLKQYLVVTAHYDDNTDAVVSDYTLSGTLTAGTSTITASYGGKTATFTVAVTERDPLDDEALGGMTYRELFEGQYVLFALNFDDGTIGTSEIVAGSPTVTNEDYHSKSYSLKAFGNGSAQIRSQQVAVSAGSYYFACYIKCTRYVAGYAGVQLAYGSTQSNCATQGVTDGWEQKSLFQWPTGNRTYKFYVGSYSSADLDTYVDDFIAIDVTSLANSMGVDITKEAERAPFKAQMDAAYAEYINIKNAE